MSLPWRVRHKPNLDHAASADGAQIEAVTSEDSVALTIVDSFGTRRRRRRLKRRSDAHEFGGTAGVRREAKMTDAAEPLRQYVEQKATHELLSIERHHFGFVAGAIILPPEANTAVLTGKEPAVGDRNAMGVAPEIGENLLWPAEGTLGVDDPFELVEGVQLAAECRRFNQVREVAEELELGIIERRLETPQEQPTIQS